MRVSSTFCGGEPQRAGQSGTMAPRFGFPRGIPITSMGTPGPLTSSELRILRPPRYSWTCGEHP